jgi:hypothetical protein
VITDILKNGAGSFEINRVVGALGSLSYIVGANAFEMWEVVVMHKAFDLVSYCTTFPFGLGVAVGSIAGAVALKDRSVAVARVTDAQADQVSNGGTTA